jgi:hypothetical protein
MDVLLLLVLNTVINITPVQNCLWISLQFNRYQKTHSQKNLPN